MVRYKTIVACDGTNFNGFQKQSNGRTVREEIEKTLQKTANGKEITVFGSERTDARVHAIGQVIHFDYPRECPLERVRFALDTQSPEGIAARQVEVASENLRVRYLVKERIYQSRVGIGKPHGPFRRHYTGCFPCPPNLEKVQRALPDLLGTHDLTSFRASGSSVEDRICTIYEAKMKVNETKDELLFIFRGNDFLYKMVWILVGTLLKIGNGWLSKDGILGITAKKNRNAAGPTAHPEGLYLYEVRYE